MNRHVWKVEGKYTYTGDKIDGLYLGGTDVSEVVPNVYADYQHVDYVKIEKITYLGFAKESAK